MIQIDRNIARQFKEGEITTKDLADYLLRTYPASEIALALAETFAFDMTFKPIAITQEEFDRHFRIKGVRPDGTPENRGTYKRKDRDI